ncbi:MAG: UDP-N-acetylmuramate dehydrogenase, partial [Hyphomicrobiales bacterium]|nr:UDP-N-acetylmuramate dehydrogenase [Hyphomicrobiales bacterium]
PVDEDDLALFLGRCSLDVPLTIVGVGSNLLVRDGGIPGVVIRLGGKAFGAIDIDADGKLSAGAAALDMRVAKAAAAAGRGGLAFYAGIPGSIGGALRMNAGAHGVETKDVVESVSGLTRAGLRQQLTSLEMNFSYRRSEPATDLIYTAAVFDTRASTVDIETAAISEIEAVRAASQPVKTRTGGSTFKNPPGYSAWKLIDEAGLRGFRVGGAHMSQMHTNFVINDDGATAFDIESLGETVRARVFAQSGIKLEWEIKRIGEFRDGQFLK